VLKNAVPLLGELPEFVPALSAADSLLRTEETCTGDG
jgi:hypothetical protein